MRKFIKKKLNKAGTAPGTLVHTGDKKAERTRITLVEFNAEQLNETAVADIEDAYGTGDTATEAWINVDGIHDMDLIQKIGDHFSIHSLTLEDIANSGQRAKMEDYDNYVYFVLQMLHYR